MNQEKIYVMSDSTPYKCDYDVIIELILHT